MKKMTLLFTILCVGQLYGMKQPEQGHFRLGDLPIEAKAVVITALNTYDDPNDVIKAIKAISITNKELNKIVNEMYGNPSGFKALVHALAKGFTEKGTFHNPFDYAYIFGTPASENYYNLYKKLQGSIREGNVADAKKAIAEGADVNGGLLLHTLITSNKPTASMTKLLLEHGADPNAKNHMGQIALNILNFSSNRNTPEYEQIKQLLEEAMKK